MAWKITIYNIPYNVDDNMIYYSEFILNNIKCLNQHVAASSNDQAREMVLATIARSSLLTLRPEEVG